MIADYAAKKHNCSRDSGKDVTMKCRNVDMYNMLVSTEKFIDTATGKFGYAIARNVRKLRDACSEYLQSRIDLINELGEPAKDENGEPTGDMMIKIGTPEYEKYFKKMSEYAGIEHDVELYKIPYSDLPDNITANDMIALEWMLFEEDENDHS